MNKPERRRKDANEEKKSTLVFIHWIDSAGWHGGWSSEEQARGLRPVVCESIGMLCGEGADYLSITTTEANNGQRQAPLTIPKCAILEWGEFKPHVTKRHGRKT